MKFERVVIQGLACVDAPVVVSSADLEARLAPTMARLQMKPGMIESLTGVRERRFWEAGLQPSDVASLAGLRALDAAGVAPERVGVLISSSVCKDYIEPSVASMVHRNLGLAPGCLNFDVGNACLAFLNAMTIVGNMIERGQVDYGLVVDGESSRLVVEKTVERLLEPSADEQRFRENFATFTLGSGAVAMVLARDDLAPAGHRFVGGVSMAATEFNHLCRGQRDEMVTDAGKLLVHGIELAGKTYALARQELGWRGEELDELVLHQVSAYHTARLAEALGLDLGKVYAIYGEFGNVGPASIPMALAKAAEAGRLAKGERVALMGIGSGLNCSMMEVVW